MGPEHPHIADYHTATSNQTTFNAPISNIPYGLLTCQSETDIDCAPAFANTTATAGSWVGSADGYPPLAGDGVAATNCTGVITSRTFAPHNGQVLRDEAMRDTSPHDASSGPYYPPFDALLPFSSPQVSLGAAPFLDTSPFDITIALALLESRPDPRLDLGTTHVLLPFVVTDAWDPLDRVIFVSDSFLALTGYAREEVVGWNCRFLQSPEGVVEAGVPRRSISSASAYLLKQKVRERCETAHSIINFKKSGEAFMNHLALVPIPWGTTTTPRFIFGFSNVFDFVPPTTNCQSSLDTPSCLVSGQNSLATRQSTGQTSATGWPGLPAGDLNQPVNATSKADELMNLEPVDIQPMDIEPLDVESINSQPTNTESAIVDSVETCVGVVEGEASNDPPDLLSCLQELVNGGLSPDTPSWNETLLENTGALVQVLSLKGVIVYASKSHETLGYNAGDLLGQTIDDLYHPSDVAMLTRQIKNKEDVGLELTLRLKGKSGQCTWFQSTGSIWSDGGRRWATLTLLPQPTSYLSCCDLHGNERFSKHGFWVKLAPSGLILHLYDDPQKPLGLPAEDLVGTSFQDMMEKSKDKAQFEKTLLNAARNEVASLTVSLTSGRGHRLETHIELRPGPPGDNRRRAFYLLGHCGFVRPYSKKRKAPSLENSHNLASTSHAIHPWSPRNQTGQGDGDDNNVLGTLDADQCGPLGYEIYQLKMANQILNDEMQELLKNAKRRRRYRLNEDAVDGCANCHTTISPEWRRGPTGKRNLCNRCGLKWSKMRHDAEAENEGHASTKQDGLGIVEGHET
ncbi:PAS domain-containing protein [Apiospora arundinis]|uniref:PAS domain-containing protein n=1 Tax=Apiospora arundinis TaxID=335852 RepID=A0ABR2IBF6_9PEZI